MVGGPLAEDCIRTPGRSATIQAVFQVARRSFVASHLRELLSEDTLEGGGAAVLSLGAVYPGMDSSSFLTHLTPFSDIGEGVGAFGTGTEDPVSRSDSCELASSSGVPASVQAGKQRGPPLQVVLEREILVSPAGEPGSTAGAPGVKRLRSVCRVNGTPVPLKTLRAVGRLLVDVNGQNSQVRTRSSYVVPMVCPWCTTAGWCMHSGVPLHSASHMQIH